MLLPDADEDTDCVATSDNRISNNTPNAGEEVGSTGSNDISHEDSKTSGMLTICRLTHNQPVSVSPVTSLTTQPATESRGFFISHKLQVSSSVYKAYNLY